MTIEAVDVALPPPETVSAQAIISTELVLDYTVPSVSFFSIFTKVPALSQPRVSTRHPIIEAAWHPEPRTDFH